MNGTEFTNKLAKECQLTQKEARDVTKAFIKLIRDELKSGGSVTLKGLGKFYATPYTRKSLTTPQGEKLEIEPHNIAKFKPSKQLRSLVAKANT